MAKEKTTIPLAPYLSVPRELVGLDIEHRAAFWKSIGKTGLYLKRQDILKGLDKWGVKFVPVKRRWGVKIPLIPHSETSRTYDLLSVNTSAQGATLFWRRGDGREPWSKILGYHAYKHGPRSLPVRNVFGLSPESEDEIMAQPGIWEEGYRAGIAAAKKAASRLQGRPETRLERILRRQREERAQETPPAPRLSAEEKAARAEAAMLRKQAAAAKKEAAAAAKLAKAEAVARRKAEAAAKKAEAEAKRVAKAEAAARKAAEREAKAQATAARKAAAVAKKEAAAARKREREEAAARRKAEVAARKADREAKAAAKKAEAGAKKAAREEAAKKRAESAKERAKARKTKTTTVRKTAEQKKSEAEEVARKKSQKDLEEQKKVQEEAAKNIQKKKMAEEKVAEEQKKIQEEIRKKIEDTVSRLEKTLAKIAENPVLSRKNLEEVSSSSEIRYSLLGMQSAIRLTHGAESKEHQAAVDRTNALDRLIAKISSEMIDRNAVANHTKGKFHGMSEVKSFNKVHFEGIDYLFEGDLTSQVFDTLVNLSGKKKLPDNFTKSTRRVIFTGNSNKDDDYWKIAYNNPDHVSMATGGDGDVVIYSRASADLGVLAHEMGHNFAYKTYGTTSPSKNKDYVAAVNSGESPVSDYAKNSLSEDFAESIRVYFVAKDFMKKIAPLRFTVIDKIFSKKGK